MTTGYRRKAVSGKGSASSGGCCKVEAVVSVDERGQMVLPKEIRERAGISAGDKLAVVSYENDGRLCCIALMKVEELSGMVAAVLGPVMQGASSDG